MAGHESAYRTALVAQAGSRLRVEPRASQFPGWVWCRDASNTGAWVPETFLEIRGDVAELTVDYDSTELTVSSGTLLEVLREVAGWAWCRDLDGRFGWVPTENLELSA